MKKNLNYIERRKCFEYLQLRYEEKIFIILKSSKNSKLPKFSEMIAVKKTNRFYQILKKFRKKINLKKEQGIFFFTNNDIILSGNFSIQNIYDKYKNKDGFLYIQVSTVEEFG